MLLYTKIVKEEEKPVRKVYGTEGNIPAETDKEVVCKDASGAALTIKAGDTYLDNGKGGIVRASDKAAVNVYVEDKLVIGEEKKESETKEDKKEEVVEEKQEAKKASRKAVKVEVEDEIKE